MPRIEDDEDTSEFRFSYLRPTCYFTTCTCLSDYDEVVYKGYLINSLPVKSYLGRELCRSPSDIPLFSRHKPYQQVLLLVLARPQIQGDILFLSHRKDPFFVRSMRTRKPLFKNDRDDVQDFLSLRPVMDFPFHDYRISKQDFIASRISTHVTIDANIFDSQGYVSKY